MITISKDKSKLDSITIHNFLTHTYWGKGRTLQQVEKTIEHSMCFGVYEKGNQIGFARVVTDHVVFVYIMDVFILPAYRGKGYSKQLIKEIVEDQELKTCKTWMLKTADAHGLYKQYGFTSLKDAEKVMELIKVG